MTSITSTTATNNTANTTQSASSAATATNNENFDTFLKILTTQLQNQDPLSPMESSEFTNQLVMFSQAEQDIQQNANLEQLINITRNNLGTSLVGYIGRDVEVKGNQLYLNSQKPNNIFYYDLPSQATKTTVTIQDSTGKVVRTATGNTDVGKHEFTWDGKDSSGNLLSDGKYSFTVSSADKDGKDITATYSTINYVSGVERTANEDFLLSGDLRVNLGNISFIREKTTS